MQTRDAQATEAGAPYQYLFSTHSLYLLSAERALKELQKEKPLPKSKSKGAKFCSIFS